jgi:mono/diheme cytochrome c family protein
MMSTILSKARLRAAMTWLCLTFTVGAVRTATEAPAGSDGWQIPDRAATEHNPVPLDAAVLARGQGIYRSKCQGCHGVHGRGDGPDGDPKHAPGDLTDARRTARNPDGVMFYKIWNGRANPKMPAMKAALEPSDVWRVIHYVKTLRTSEAPTSR